MAMELPLFLGDGPDAALFSSLWSSFPDDLQPPPQQEVPFIFFLFSQPSISLSLDYSMCRHRISLFFFLPGGLQSCTGMMCRRRCGCGCGMAAADLLAPPHVIASRVLDSSHSPQADTVVKPG
jgi:hypothetical protein